MFEVIVQDRSYRSPSSASALRDRRMSDLPPPHDFLQSPNQDMLNLPFLSGSATKSQTVNSSSVFATIGLSLFIEKLL
jgi:hypothetical protein